jgi:hypothetical protein
MKRVYQQIRHNPDGGQIGDCHRAAIASLLELPMEQVPHFAERTWDDETGAFTALVEAFLHSRGLSQVIIAYDGSTALVDLLQIIGAGFPQTYYLIGVTSVRGTRHSIIGCGTAIVFDPHLDGNQGEAYAPIASVWSLTFFVPLALCKTGIKS